MKLRSYVLSLAALWALLYLAAPARAGSERTITVVGKEFAFIPHEVLLHQGDRVTLIFKNEGVLAHNIRIEKLGIHIESIHPGESATVRFHAAETGNFPFVCGVMGHKEAGMKGLLKVLPPHGDSEG